MPNSYVVVVPWEGGTCVPSKPEIEQQLRYGLVVRIPGSHPGGPGSIPGVGKLFWGSIFGSNKGNIVCIMNWQL